MSWGQHFGAGAEQRREVIVFLRDPTRRAGDGGQRRRIASALIPPGPRRRRAEATACPLGPTSGAKADTSALEGHLVVDVCLRDLVGLGMPPATISAICSATNLFPASLT